MLGGIKTGGMEAGVGDRVEDGTWGCRIQMWIHLHLAIPRMSRSGARSDGWDLAVQWLQAEPAHGAAVAELVNETGGLKEIGELSVQVGKHCRTEMTS